MKVYDYTHGVALTEQDFVSKADTFLVSTLGWTRIDTVSDSSSDRDYVWYSEGEDPENYRGIYIRMQGYANAIYNKGYGSYTKSDTYGHELYNASYSYVNCGSSALRYWMFGDKDFICYIIMGSGEVSICGYLGLINSYYLPATDPHPLLIKGNTSSSYSWNTAPCTYMYDTASGSALFGVYDAYTDALYHDVCYRASGYTMLPPVLYNNAGGKKEVRGEPKGVYQVNGNIAPHVGPIVTSSGVFLCLRCGLGSGAFVYGPIANVNSGFTSF
jgi:hypothetical protein